MSAEQREDQAAAVEFYRLNPSAALFDFRRRVNEPLAPPRVYENGRQPPLPRDSLPCEPGTHVGAGPVAPLPSAWIATGPNGKVLHFSKADGWIVDVVVTEPWSKPMHVTWERASPADVDKALARLGAYADGRKDAAAEASPQAVPAGWKLVPVEPTERMLAAAFDVYEFTPGEQGYKTGNDMRTAVYKAMVEAAPQAAPVALRDAPSDKHLSLLMAPYHLNMVVGQDRADLLNYARDVWRAALSQERPNEGGTDV